jgi:hypothetical protein
VSAATIRADGLDWPLDSFLAARGFRRLNAWEWPHLERNVEVETVTLACELKPPREAGDIRWTDVLAYRVPRLAMRPPVDEPELAL